MVEIYGNVTPNPEVVYFKTPYVRKSGVVKDLSVLVLNVHLISNSNKCLGKKKERKGSNLKRQSQLNFVLIP